MIRSPLRQIFFFHILVHLEEKDVLDKTKHAAAFLVIQSTSNFQRL